MTLKRAIRTTGEIDGRAASIYVAPEREGIWHSTDGGETWSALPEAPRNIYSWTFDRDGRVLYMTGSGFGGVEGWGVLAYDTETGAWADISPTEATVNRSGLKLDKWGGIGFESGTGAIIVNARTKNCPVFVSLDRGATWRWFNWSRKKPAPDGVRLTDEPWRSEFWVKQNGYSYVDGPHHPGIIWRSDVFNAWTIDVSEVVRNRGIIMTSQGCGLDNSSPLSMAAPSGNVLVHVGTQDVSGFSFRDYDTPARQRWSALAGLRQHNTTSVAVCYQQPRHAAIASQWAWTATTDDAGKTFTLRTQPPRAQRPQLAMNSGDPTNLVIVSSRVSWTADRGQTWQPSEGVKSVWINGSKFGNAQVVAADTVAPGRFYLLAAKPAKQKSELLRSDDNGRTFQHVGSLAGGRGKFGVQLKAAPGVDGAVWTCVGESGLWRSADAGETMQQVVGFDAANAFGFGAPLPNTDHPAAYVFGSYEGLWGIWRSTDDGDTWARIDDPRWPALARLNQIEGDPEHPGRIFLGLGGQGVAYVETLP